MKQRSELYLKDILDAIERIKTYTANSKSNRLLRKRRLDSKIVQKVETIINTNWRGAVHELKIQFE